MKIIKNDLFDYPNRYILQSEGGFKFSLDSILLSEYVKITKDITNILDMCTGNAPVPLILSTKTNANIVGYEIQKVIYDLAKQSVELNELSTQIKIINDDVKNIEKLFPGKYFDVITCNPPYFKNSNLNMEESLRVARHEITIDLDTIMNLVSLHLKENGVFYMVHRPERIDEIFNFAFKYKLRIKEIQLVITKDDAEPSILLLKIKKHAKEGVKFKKIINVSKYSTYQHIFEEEKS